jgi:hypothetical protein
MDLIDDRRMASCLYMARGFQSRRYALLTDSVLVPQTYLLIPSHIIFHCFINCFPNSCSSRANNS